MEKTVYRVGIAKDGSKVETYRIKEHGEVSKVTVSGQVWYPNPLATSLPFLKDSMQAIRVEVSHPRRKEVEVLQFQSLEQALDHHDMLMEDIDRAYTGTGNTLEPNRFDTLEEE